MASSIVPPQPKSFWQSSLLFSSWELRRPSYTKQLRGLVANPNLLYNMAAYTLTLLEGAAIISNVSLLSELAEVYTAAEHALVNVTAYDVYMGGGVESFNLSQPSPMWVGTDGRESLLASSQWLYAMARLTHVATELPVAHRTAQLKSFLRFANRVTLDGGGPRGAYMRWVLPPPGHGVWQVHGWGCKGAPASVRHNHRQFLELKLARALGSNYKYCNAVTDKDLWVITGVVELLAAHDADPIAVPLPDKTYAALLAYVRLGAKLIDARFSTTALVDAHGEPATGLVFDAGSWDDHPDYRYVGYTNASQPPWKPDSSGHKRPPRPPNGTSTWDLSHGRRFVPVSLTLTRSRNLALGKTEYLPLLCNQFLYASAARDAFSRPHGKSARNSEGPLFHTFMDGANGWYAPTSRMHTTPLLAFEHSHVLPCLPFHDFRYGVPEPSGGGIWYQPFDVSAAGLEGGWNLWAKWCPGIDPLMRKRVWPLVSSTDPNVTAWRRQHYGTYWRGDPLSHPPSPPDQCTVRDPEAMLMFLPTMLDSA